MSRIKKRGLDYFPLNTDFIHDRLVRRIMKREGDGSFAILLGALSCIYADEGYYVHADELFYEDLSACLYEKTAADVKRILALAVEYGIFDAALFREHAVLTSAEIQRQYLFSTKRRKSSVIDVRYCLLDDAQADEDSLSAGKGVKPAVGSVTFESGSVTSAEAGSVTSQSGSVTFRPESVTFNPENVTSRTHSIAQHSKENPLLHSSPETGGTAEGAAVPSAEEEYLRKIEQLRPPQDGTARNLDGLLFNLRQFHISPQEQYAIVLKSNFGAIGHPLWKGFYALRESRGKIRQPGRYLLSLCCKQVFDM